MSPLRYRSWAQLLGSVLAICSLASAQERSLAQLYEIGGGATWVYELAEERIGAHHMRFLGAPDPLAPDVLLFECWTRLSPTAGLPVEQRYHAKLWCRGDGEPLAEASMPLSASAALTGDAGRRATL